MAGSGAAQMETAWVPPGSVTSLGHVSASPWSAAASVLLTLRAVPQPEGLWMCALG